MFGEFRPLPSRNDRVFLLTSRFVSAAESAISDSTAPPKNLRGLQRAELQLGRRSERKARDIWLQDIGSHGRIFKVSGVLEGMAYTLHESRRVMFLNSVCRSAGHIGRERPARIDPLPFRCRSYCGRRCRPSMHFSRWSSRLERCPADGRVGTWRC